MISILIIILCSANVIIFLFKRKKYFDNYSKKSKTDLAQLIITFVENNILCQFLFKTFQKVTALKKL